jgi:multidrug resistance efflux pump
MHPNPRRVVPVVVAVAVIAGGAWLWRSREAGAADALAASGTIEAVDVHVAAELGGRITAVHVQEGQAVRAGEALAEFDTALLEAQRDQAAAALAAAQASLAVLEAGPSSEAGQAAIARSELELLLAQQALQELRDNGALRRAQAQLAVATANDNVFDEERDLSGVQYPDVPDYTEALADAEERLVAAESQQTINDIGSLGASIQAAQDVVESAQERLGAVQTAEQGCGGCDPDRLARAQDNLNGALNNLETLQLQQQNSQMSAADTIEAAQEAVQDAQENLAAAQAGPNARDLSIAQAELAVAQAQLANARQNLEEMTTSGLDPDALAAAEARVLSAQAALAAARAGASPEQLEAARAQVDVASAALRAAEAQLQKMTLFAPADGIVLSRVVEPGEFAGPGATLFVIGRLDELTITVYVPEDRYGRIRLGQAAGVRVDSFPGQEFAASVVHIADQAEFTPRNVQTAEGRKTTVFAIKLAVENAEGRLKPGMPADVEFEG